MLKWTKHLAGAVLLIVGTLMLSACGGGGGGGGGSSKPSVSLMLSNVVVPSVDQEVFEGNDPIQQITVKSDIAGDIASLNGATVYVVVEDAQQLFSGEAQISLGPNGIGNTLTIFGRSQNVKVGDFSGELLVNVCLDLACTRPFQGSPIRVPYRVKVIPGLKLMRTDPVALSATFPASSSSWVSQVVLPQGATSLVSILGLGSQTANGYKAFDLVQGVSTVTITGKPAAVGSYDGSLYLAAVGYTSRGRQTQLSLSIPLNYTVTGQGNFQILYSPQQLNLTVRSTETSYASGGYVDSLASDGRAYWLPNRIDYLPGDGVTTQSAKNVRWLRVASFGPGDRTGGNLWTGFFGLDATACNSSATGFDCLAPGQYDALIYPSTELGEESPVPLRVRLTVIP